jgi:hypothetical protein
VFLGPTLLAIGFALGLGLATPSGSVDAAAAVAKCVRQPDGTYNCDKQLAVGDHIELDNLSNVCHGDVTATGTGPGGLLTAKVKISHNVALCPWSSGTTVTIAYRVVVPTPVGGLAGLIDRPAAAGAVAAGDTGAGWAYLPVAIAAVGALFAFVFARRGVGAAIRAARRGRPAVQQPRR